MVISSLNEPGFVKPGQATKVGTAQAAHSINGRLQSKPRCSPDG